MSSEAEDESRAKNQRAGDDFLVGGGAMAKLIQAMDWSKTPLGPMSTWPQSLRTTLSLAQASNSPISIAWGPGHVQIYNDGYWPICGEKHPESMGQDFRECWASAFPVIGEAYASAMSGKSAYLEKMRMFLDRYGFLEETWFTFSFSPITDESGGVAGLFHPVTEMTSAMLSERRTKTLRDLASRAGRATTTDDVFEQATRVLAESELDLPFVLFYVLDGTEARLTGATGSDDGALASAARLSLVGDDPDPWGVRQVASTHESKRLDDVAQRLEGMRVGPYPELPRTAFTIPILQPGSDVPAAVMVAGVSARLRIDEPYRGFYDLVAASVATALANARAYEEERKKADALAAIDQAKTAFFSNVSHEFRTPLTLMLAPIEDALSSPTRSLSGASLEMVRRNVIRLMRLVNSLLDFSRIEAGRVQAAYEPTDLAKLTADLASVFRSAIERTGLEFRVDCEAIPEPTHVDHDMWEKIVLNLLSNALKFTFEGSITISLSAHDDSVELEVRDTGTGIPEHELPHLFERFHRVHGAASRTYEGSGIGLALVSDLVKLHGGRVRVASVVGEGTTFGVSIPRGTAHLPRERIVPARGSFDIARGAAPFVEEATRWSLPPSSVGARAAPKSSLPALGASRILVVDDNADLRDYIATLLQEEYEVETAVDGVEALAKAKAHRPTLVLSDVMMPNLDGFGLLRALRAEPQLAEVPVLLLSARAGEESTIEGLGAGADDYLVKPFAARELLARVRTHVELGRQRQAVVRAKVAAESANRELEAFSYSVAHDLRAPLRAIDGFSQALLEDYGAQLDDGARQYLGFVREGAQRMAELIDSLLALSRVSRAEVHRETMDLGALARVALGRLKRSEPNRVVEVVVEGGLFAEGDPALLSVAFDNLLGNAWKFTGKTPDARIEFGVSHEGDKPVYFVRDNGAGFDMAYKNKLFGVFQRLHTASEFEGTGVGLATVQRVIRRHGGRVWADGAVGRGATFYFTLHENETEL